MIRPRDTGGRPADLPPLLPPRQRGAAAMEESRLFVALEHRLTRTGMPGTLCGILSGDSAQARGLRDRVEGIGFACLILPHLSQPRFWLERLSAVILCPPFGGDDLPGLIRRLHEAAPRAALLLFAPEPDAGAAGVDATLVPPVGAAGLRFGLLSAIAARATRLPFPDSPENEG